RLNGTTSTIVRAAGFQPNDLTLIHADGTPQHAKVYGVSEGFFDVFGLPMTLGGFTPENFQAPAPRVAGAQPGPPPVFYLVISYRVWKELYQSDPAIVGKPSQFAELPMIIAGVAPREFDTPHRADFWLAQRLGKDDINH